MQPSEFTAFIELAIEIGRIKAERDAAVAESNAFALAIQRVDARLDEVMAQRDACEAQLQAAWDACGAEQDETARLRAELVDTRDLAGETLIKLSQAYVEIDGLRTELTARGDLPQPPMVSRLRSIATDMRDEGEYTSSAYGDVMDAATFIEAVQGESIEEHRE